MMRTWYAEDGSTVEAGKVQGHTHCGSPSTGLTVSLITVGGQQYECSQKLAPTVEHYLIKGGDGEFSLMHEEEFRGRYGADPRQQPCNASDGSAYDANTSRPGSNAHGIGPDTDARQVGVGGAAGTPVGLTGGFSEVEKPSDTE